MPRRKMREQETLFPVDNLLYCGDNLEVLRLYGRDESVDVIYLDPPFKKHANYNVLFKELSGRKAASQVAAFLHTWTWDETAWATYREMTEQGPERVSKAMQAFRTFLGESEMLAYLSMMAPRLVQLRRVLRPTGNIYLHCDPAAGHYLKLLMDAVFGPKAFLNEIIWHYRTSGGAPRKWLIRNHDTLLRYAKDPKLVKWNAPREPWPESTLRKWQRDEKGRIYRVQHRFNKRYYIDPRGKLADDVWELTLASRSHERLGYPTQKSEALLDLIIKASSDPGDTVLDPFCGCGTTISAAQTLDRKWIGIDITNRAIDEIVARLIKAYGPEIQKTYEIRWEPVSLDDAAVLADKKPLDFQSWAVRRAGGIGGKRGADRGIDGRIYFHDEPDGDTRQVIISVKGGGTGPRHVRELKGALDQEGADIGVLITIREPTIEMRRAASAADNYISTFWDDKYPRIQLLTVEGLLAGKEVRYPRGDKLVGRMALAQEPEGELVEPQMVEPRRDPKREPVE